MYSRLDFGCEVLYFAIPLLSLLRTKLGSHWDTGFSITWIFVLCFRALTFSSDRDKGILMAALVLVPVGRLLLWRERNCPVPSRTLSTFVLAFAVFASIVCIKVNYERDYSLAPTWLFLLPVFVGHSKTLHSLLSLKKRINEQRNYAKCLSFHCLCTWTRSLLPLIFNLVEIW